VVYKVTLIPYRHPDGHPPAPNYQGWAHALFFWAVLTDHFSPHFTLRLMTTSSCKLTVDAEGTVTGTLGLSVAEPDATGLLLDLFVCQRQ
jgi:hypothetical protein